MIARGLDRIRRAVGARNQPQPHPTLVELTDEDRRYLTSLYDDRMPLPEGAERELRQDNPRLLELKERYKALRLPVLTASRWNAGAVQSFFDLRYFRGETLITWHYRELRRISELKFFIFTRFVQDHDRRRLLDRLSEDGAFGCWTFSYPGYGTVSRDLLESINEMNFLDRHVDLFSDRPKRVLDIGAGYGRLAHRMTEAHKAIEDYCCVDAIAESTFISEYYLTYRGCDRARVVALDRLDDELESDWFDVAVNIHSFSECTLDAVTWWIVLLARLRVSHLLVVPNEPTDLLTLEPDGKRFDFLPVLEREGYRLQIHEPVISDEAARGLLNLHDHFFLFERIA